MSNVLLWLSKVFVPTFGISWIIQIADNGQSVFCSLITDLFFLQLLGMKCELYWYRLCLILVDNKGAKKTSDISLI